jgi:hypothetical protein
MAPSRIIRLFRNFRARKKKDKNSSTSAGFHAKEENKQTGERKAGGGVQRWHRIRMKTAQSSISFSPKYLDILLIKDDRPI